MRIPNEVQSETTPNLNFRIQGVPKIVFEGSTGPHGHKQLLYEVLKVIFGKLF